MRNDNYPPDYDPRIDSGEDEDELDLVGDYDDSDEFRENNPHLFDKKEEGNLGGASQ